MSVGVDFRCLLRALRLTHAGVYARGIWLNLAPDQQDALWRVEGQATKPEVEQFNLTESLVRGHLRDIPRQVRCAICLARELHLSPSDIGPILATLAERQPRSRQAAAAAAPTGSCTCRGSARSPGRHALAGAEQVQLAKLREVRTCQT
jgi:hypothetical protein